MPEFFGWVNVVGDGAIFHQKISGVSFPFGGTFPGGLIFSQRNVRLGTVQIPSLHPAVMILATLVNTHTDTQMGRQTAGF